MTWFRKIIEEAAIAAAREELERQVRERLPSIVAEAFYDLAMKDPQANLSKMGFVNVVGAALHVRHGWDFVDAKKQFCDWMSCAGIKFGDPDYMWRSVDAVSLADEFKSEASTW